MPVNETVIDAVATNNVKTIGETLAHSAALAAQNAVAHQGRMNVIAEAAVGNIVKNLTEMDPAQSASVLKALSGNDLAQQLSALLAAVASGQQQVKGAQTTPPPTAGIPPV